MRLNRIDCDECGSFCHATTTATLEKIGERRVHRRYFIFKIQIISPDLDNKGPAIALVQDREAILCEVCCARKWPELTKIAEGR